MVVTISNGHKLEIAENRNGGVLYFNKRRGIVPFSAMIKFHEGDQIATWTHKDADGTLDVTKKTLIEFLVKITDYAMDHIDILVTQLDDKEETD